MKIPVSQLIGPALDWAVAKCERLCPRVSDKWILSDVVGYSLCFSADWAQGGPIIEQNFIGLWRDDRTGVWGANKQGIPFQQFGPTPLIAAMRCRVSSKMGYCIDIPDELV